MFYRLILDVDGQPGTLLVLSYKIKTHSKELKPMHATVNSNLINEIETSESLTLSFSETHAQNEKVSGGKGASLAYLTNLLDKIPNNSSMNNFIVPHGFIVTTNSFNFHVEKNQQLLESIKNLEKVAFNCIDGSLELACKNVKRLLIDTPLADNIKNAIKNNYDDLLKDSIAPLKLAVRSSAVGEDSVETSSAGQNKTFLGIIGFEELLIAIQKCWASLFSVQSVTYRAQNIQPIHAEMAVAVQCMVPSDCAGVMFTNHPINKDPSKLLITANYGLGEVCYQLFQRRMFP